MFKSAAQEFGEWAERCRSWARTARDNEQRRTLQHWERLFVQAEREAEQNFDLGYGAAPRLPTKS
jgi:hypothetical protein